MSSTQFSMVEELASLVKDNLPSKHLILSIEELLVSFIQGDTSLGGVLELEPMNPYNRLLVHRLADIFGFSHQSVGEGEARHLVLESCPDTSMPPILVSDFLQYDEIQSPIISKESIWKEVIPGQRDSAGSKLSFAERETSYFAARERIFSADASETRMIKERPKHDPVVARRMITHALGQSNKVMKHELSLSDTKGSARAAKGLRTQYVDERAVNSNNELETVSPPDEQCTATNIDKVSGSKSTDFKSKGPQPKNDSQENYMRKEHMGAAKRLFANALGAHRRDFNLSKCNETKKTSC